MKILRNMDTPESRAFWEAADRVACEVQQWPAWKRAGINVSQQRSVPRPVVRLAEVDGTGEE